MIHKFRNSLPTLSLPLCVFICGLSFGFPCSSGATTWDFRAIPRDGLKSNVGVDIVSHDGAVWLGSSNGVSYTLDIGATFFTFDNATGLNSENVSAMFSRGDTIWLATATTIEDAGGFITAGDGIQFSWDNGASWPLPDDTALDVAGDTKGLMEKSTSGGNLVVFDIAGSARNVYAATFAAGMIGTDDGGVTWKRFYPSPNDSVKFVNRDSITLAMRVFSVVADTVHPDSEIVYVGSAAGVTGYHFWPMGVKPASNNILDYTADPATQTIFLGSDRGLSKAAWRTYSGWRSVFASDGLASNVVNQLHYFGGQLFVGCVDTVDGLGVGFQRVNSALTSFTPLSLPGVNFSIPKLGGAVYDFADFGGNLYTALGTYGLFVSHDSGFSWSRMYSDTAVASDLSARNFIYAVRADSLGDLWLGTDSGAVQLFVASDGATIDSARYFVVQDSKQISVLGGSGGSVRRIEIQNYRLDDTALVIDSSVVWAAAAPHDTATGEFATYRIAPGLGVVDTMLIKSRTLQMAHRGGVVCFVGPDGFRILTSYTPPTPDVAMFSVPFLRDTSYIPNRVDTSRAHNAVLLVGDTLHVGKRTSFGVCPNENFLPTGGGSFANKWHLIRANVDPFGADSIRHFSYRDSLPGEFVVALAVQYSTGPEPIIWAGTRPTFSPQTVGVARLDFNEPAITRRWRRVDLPGVFAWNFAFNGDSVFVATDSGLFMSVAPDSVFTRQEIRSSVSDILIPATASINGVAVIDGRLWVASDEGFANKPLGDPFFDVHRVLLDSLETFAYPAPFSPLSGSNDGKLKFKYQVPLGANSVSINIYDFAMNLVRNVNQNVPRTAGESVNGRESDKWDGTSRDGRVVSPGIYYFRLKFSNGDVKWGKLAIIP